MRPSDDRQTNDQERLSLGPRETRSFHIILILTLVAISIWLLVSEVSQQTPMGIASLALLLVIHTGLHWGSIYLGKRPRWIYPYLTLQCLVIVAIAAITSGSIILVAFFLALASQALSLIQKPRPSIPVVAVILLVSLATFVASDGWSNILSWLALVVPMGLFSFFYIMMFGLQARSRAEAQQLLRELEIAHNQLADYATKVEDLTMKAERERIARELHDTLAQGLAGLILQLEAADSHLSHADEQKAKQIIEQAMARARSTLAGARQAIANLRTGPPSAAELEIAIQAEVERFSRATGIECEVEIDLQDELTNTVAENALRAVSEGLTNVAKHARASRVWLSMRTSAEMLEIALHDDGVGFEESEVDARGGHFGLLGLRERARLGGGSIQLQGVAGEGTTLIMRLPLVQGDGGR